MTTHVWPAAIRALVRDSRLGARSMQVWLIVAPDLVASEFRPLIPADIAQSLALTRPVVTAALKELVDCGYLERGERIRPNGPLGYRLPVAHAAPVATPAPTPNGVARPARRMYSTGIDP